MTANAGLYLRAIRNIRWESPFGPFLISHLDPNTTDLSLPAKSVVELSSIPSSPWKVGTRCPLRNREARSIRQFDSPCVTFLRKNKRPYSGKYLSELDISRASSVASSSLADRIDRAKAKKIALIQSNRSSFNHTPCSGCGAENPLRN